MKHISPQTKDILTRMKQVNPEDWGKLLGIKGSALTKAMEINQHILTSPTRPAIERYTGVVYKAIDYPTLPPKAKTFFHHHVRIISALFGLLSPADLIPDYKLKINTLKCDQFWKHIHKETMHEIPVLDLLPQAHKKAFDLTHALSIDFCYMKNGKTKPAGHAGKHIKGRFIRYVCEKQSTAVKTLSDFTEEGFEWREGTFVKQV